MVSIAIAVLDTLRKDAFDRHFDWLPGTHYEQAYSISHWTVPAHAALYTGYYPSELGVHGKAPALDCSEPVLAEQFQDAGYDTRLISANPNIVYHDGWTRGFDEVKTPHDIAVPENLFDWPKFVKSSEKSGLPLYYEGVKQCISRDSATLSSLLFAARLKRQGGIDSLLTDDGAAVVRDYIRDQEFENPEFLLINLMEAHTPYDPPGAYNTAGKPVDAVFGKAVANEIEDETRVRQAYDDAVRYLADVYREIFEELQTSFDYVITLSDHGECLGEHDMWNHGYGLYPELIHVPLVISNSTDSQNKREETGVVSLIDIYQTLCDLAGINTTSRGINIFETSRTESVLTEYHGLLSWHYEQLRRYGVSEATIEEYDSPLAGIVTAEGDYGYETHTSGFRAKLNQSEFLRQELTRKRSGIDSVDINQEGSTVSGEIEDQLRNLGYM